MNSLEIKLDLPLPMSVNAMYAWNPHLHRKVYKTPARRWLEDVSSYIALKLPRGHTPINQYTTVDLDFWLPRRNADSHNYKKLLFDALQQGGLFEDDRYILDCTRSVQIDPKNPRVVVTVKRVV